MYAHQPDGRPQLARPRRKNAESLTKIGLSWIQSLKPLNNSSVSRLTLCVKFGIIQVRGVGLTSTIRL
jgi:hypothetical protein